MLRASPLFSACSGTALLLVPNPSTASRHEHQSSSQQLNFLTCPQNWLQMPIWMVLRFRSLCHQLFPLLSWAGAEPRPVNRRNRAPIPSSTSCFCDTHFNSCVFLNSWLSFFLPLGPQGLPTCLPTPLPQQLCRARGLCLGARKSGVGLRAWHVP